MNKIFLTFWLFKVGYSIQKRVTGSDIEPAQKEEYENRNEK